MCRSGKEFGERGWTRTIDPCLKRALLCQLSYAPTRFQFNTAESRSQIVRCLVSDTQLDWAGGIRNLDVQRMRL